jgi:hypothetical protein
VESNLQGETAMSEEVRDFHFNVNVRTGGGSKAKMANNEDSFLRAMEIQGRKREKRELERLEEERIAASQAPVETDEPVLSEAPVVEEEATESVEVPEATTPAQEEVPEAPPAVPTPAAPKPSGGGVPGPTPRSDFTTEEKSAMLKRAKAHAAEVRARKK